MAIVKAVKSGSWSDPTLWNTGILPADVDDVYSNGYTVEIDQDVTVNSISNKSASGITGSGVFNVSSSGRVINADIVGGGNSRAIQIYTSCVINGDASLDTESSSRTGIYCGGGSNVLLVGNIYGTNNGAHSNSYTVLIDHDTAVFSLVGNVYSGSGGANSDGIRMAKAGCYCYVTGNVYAGGTHGIRPYLGTLLSITGDVYGGDSSGNGVRADGACANITIVGSVIGGGVASALYNNSSANIQVSIARGNNYPIATSPAPGIESYSSVAILVDALEYGDYGMSPADGLVKFRLSGVNYILAKDENLNLLNLGEVSADYPLESDVRSGVLFDFGLRAGTCSVPPAGSVALGVPVDAGVGDAVLSPDALLGSSLIEGLAQCVTDAAKARKMATNKAVISADGLSVTVYDDDGETPIHVYGLSSDKLIRTPL